MSVSTDHEKKREKKREKNPMGNTFIQVILSFPWKQNAILCPRDTREREREREREGERAE